MGNKYNVCNFIRFIPVIKLGIRERKRKRKRKRKERRGKRAQSLGKKRDWEKKPNEV